MSTSSASSTLLQLSRKAAAIRAAELPRFQALFPKLVRQLTEPNCEATDQTSSIIEHSLFREKPNSTSSSEIDHAHRWLSSMLQYNVPHGKLARGLALSINYQILQYGYEAVEQGTPETLLQSSEKDLTNARVLGWCVELFQAYFLVLDDIMDGSITRRGQPCWYRKVSCLSFYYSKRSFCVASFAARYCIYTFIFCLRFSLFIYIIFFCCTSFILC